MNQKNYAIVIPVLNEEKRVGNGILELEKFIFSQLKNYLIKVVIVDGGSVDKTVEIVKKFQQNFSNLYLKISKKGKGRQLKKVFSEEETDFFIQMDVDLAVPLKYLKELIFWLEKDYDIVIGSRLKKQSEVKRTFIRKALGRGYSFLVRLLFQKPILDYQCGFKGFQGKKLKSILSEVKDKNWIFDTELILKGLKKGFKIKEIPVEWEEKTGSKLNILKQTFSMFFSLLKLRFKM